MSINDEYEQILIALALTLSEIDASPPPPRPYVERLVVALEKRGWSIVRNGNKWTTMDEFTGGPT